MVNQVHEKEGVWSFRRRPVLRAPSFSINLPIEPPGVYPTFAKRTANGRERI